MFFEKNKICNEFFDLDCPVLALHGFIGSGKTSFAKQLAYEHLTKDDCVWVFDMADNYVYLSEYFDIPLYSIDCVEFNPSMVYNSCSAIFNLEMMRRNKECLADFLKSVFLGSLETIQKSKKKHILIFDRSNFLFFNNSLWNSFFDFIGKLKGLDAGVVLLFQDLRVVSNALDSVLYKKFEKFQFLEI